MTVLRVRPCMSRLRMPSRMHRSGMPRPRIARGFTLLEILVVLFLMGLAYGLAAPMIGSGAASLELKGATRQLAAGLRKARGEAITRRQEAVLTLDVGQRRFAVSGDGRAHALPERIEVALVTARSEQLDNQVGNIRFFPDGTSTGGRITLSLGETRQALEVDWLTGKVSVTP